MNSLERTDICKHGHEYRKCSDCQSEDYVMAMWKLAQDKVKSEKFDSFQSAIDHLSAKVKLSYQGRVGHMAEACLYTYESEGKVRDVWVYLDGKVEFK